MRWSPLTRSRYRIALTPKGAWILALLVILWGFRPTYAGWDAVGRNIIIGYVQVGVDLFLLISALLLLYRSLISERTMGSIKFLLGLPLTRTQILLGKTGGRFVGVGTAAVAATLILTAISLIEHGTFALLPFLGTLITTLLFAEVMVAIGAFVSTVARRTMTAATGMFAYFLATMFWSRIVTPLYATVTGVPVDPYDTPASRPLFLALRLTPNGAYNVLTNWFLGVGNSTELFHIVYTKLEPGISVNAFVVEAVFDDGAPWYLHPALSLVVLLIWAIVPMALARRAFTRGDTLRARQSPQSNSRR